MEDLSDNPFTALFPSVSVAQTYKQARESVADDVKQARIETIPSKTVDVSDEEELKKVHELNSVIEEIFLFTLNKFSVIGSDQKQLIHLTSLAEIIGATQKNNYSNFYWLDLETLEQALFERLMLENPLDNLVTDPGAKSLNHSQTIETQAVRYLVGSFRRASSVSQRQDKKSKLITDIKRMKEIIVQNLVTAFREPDFYVGQNLNKQMSEQLQTMSYDVDSDLLELLNMFSEQSKTHALLLENIFHPILDEIMMSIKNTPMILFSNNSIIPLEYFLSSPSLARILILHSYPKSSQSGRAYEDTLLGAILQKSCLPSIETSTWEFFNQPSGQPASVHSATGN